MDLRHPRWLTELADLGAPVDDVFTESDWQWTRAPGGVPTAHGTVVCGWTAVRALPVPRPGPDAVVELCCCVQRTGPLASLGHLAELIGRFHVPDDVARDNRVRACERLLSLGSTPWDMRDRAEALTLGPAGRAWALQFTAAAESRHQQRLRELAALWDVPCDGPQDWVLLPRVTSVHSRSLTLCAAAAPDPDEVARLVELTTAEAAVVYLSWRVVKAPRSGRTLAPSESPGPAEVTLGPVTGSEPDGLWETMKALASRLGPQDAYAAAQASIA